MISRENSMNLNKPEHKQEKFLWSSLLIKLTQRAQISLREKCSNTNQKKLRIWTLFMQCLVKSAFENNEKFGK